MNSIPNNNFPNIPSPRKSFEIALEKVCTSITSGFFREFAYENYYKIIEMFDENYINHFWNGVSLGKVKYVKEEVLTNG